MRIAPDFSLYDTFFRNNVRSAPTFDQSDIAGCLFIHMSLTDLRDRFGCNSDRMNAVLRIKSGVGCLPGYYHLIRNQRRCFICRVSNRSADIQYIGFFCTNFRKIKYATTLDIKLFCNCKKNLDIPVWYSRFFYTADSFQNLHKSCHIISSKNCLSCGTDHTVFSDDPFLAFGRLNRIHMAGQKDRISRKVSRKICI